MDHVIKRALNISPNWNEGFVKLKLMAESLRRMMRLVLTVIAFGVLFGQQADEVSDRLKRC
jgi:hypothetical protein